MRLRHGTFSYLPDLTDDEIAAQIRYALTTAGRCRSSSPTTRTRATSTGRCGACPCSTSTSPTASSPRSTPAGATFPQHYIRVIAYDATLGRQTTALQLPRQPARRRARLPPRRAPRASDRRQAVQRARPDASRSQPRLTASQFERPGLRPTCGCGHGPPAAAGDAPGGRPGGARRAPVRRRRLVDLACRRGEQKVEETLDRLDAELVGLAPVKRRVREIASLLLVDRARRQFGLTTTRPTLHMSFTGGPGTGKTTVAHADGRDAARPRLHPQPQGPRRHPRRPGRAVHRAHRAQDQGGHRQAPPAGCCSSTRPTTSTGRRTSATTARRSSRSCCRRWRTSGRAWWSSSPATRTGWRPSSPPTPVSPRGCRTTSRSRTTPTTSWCGSPT